MNFLYLNYSQKNLSSIGEGWKSCQNWFLLPRDTYCTINAFTSVSFAMVRLKNIYMSSATCMFSFKCEEKLFGGFLFAFLKMNMFHFLFCYNSMYGKHDISTQIFKKSNQLTKIKKWLQPRALRPPGWCLNWFIITKF